MHLQHIKQLTFAVMAVLVMAGCHKDSPSTPDIPAESAEKVVLAYLISNNNSTNLDSYLKNNIRWMYEGLAGLDKAASLLVFYRPWSTDNILTAPCILRFSTDGKGHINDEDALTGEELTNDNVLRRAVVVKEYTDNPFFATSPTTMQTVLSDMKNAVPATKYGLIFGSHATSWLKGYRTISSRSFGDDKGYSINLPEMATAITNAFGGKKAEFILFDACMMGTAEVFYELRNTTTYCVASTLESPLHGLPYDTFFQTLYNDSTDYQQVIDNTIAFNKKNQTWGTYSLVDCRKMEQLAQAVQEEILANPTTAKSVPYTDSSQLLQYGYGSTFRYFSFDVLEFIKLLNDGIVPDSFQKVFDETVLYKNSLSDKTYLKENNRFCGMGMYLPDRGIKSAWDEYYPALEWYNASGWSGLNQ